MQHANDLYAIGIVGSDVTSDVAEIGLVLRLSQPEGASRQASRQVKSKHMGKTEILAELPKLKAEERRQIFERLCELQNQDLLNSVAPTEEEKKLLDAALAEYEKDGDRGRPWREVLRDLRARHHAHELE